MSIYLDVLVSVMLLLKIIESISRLKKALLKSINRRRKKKVEAKSI